MKFADSFSIPDELKHDHSPGSVENMKQGIEKLKILLEDNHKACIEHVVTYSELNIRFFFAANLLPDKEILADAFKLYLENLISLFVKKK